MNTIFVNMSRINLQLEFAYFKSLENLIEHYTKYEDGLPGLLTKSISPMSILQNLLMPISSTMPRQIHLTQQMLMSKNVASQKLPAAAQVQQKLVMPSDVLASGQTLMNISNHQLMHQSSTSQDFNSKSNALTKASLFKSRTLLNDQSMLQIFH